MRLATPEPASHADVRSLVELMGTAEGCSPQTVWALPWNFHDYWVIRRAGRIVAAGSLQDLGDGQRAEIRGLVVHADFRGLRLASSIVEHLCDIAERAGVVVVCVTRSPRFFERHGFVGTGPLWLPTHRVDPERPAGPPRVTLARPTSRATAHRLAA